MGMGVAQEGGGAALGAELRSYANQNPHPMGLQKLGNTHGNEAGEVCYRFMQMLNMMAW